MMRNPLPIILDPDISSHPIQVSVEMESGKNEDILDTDQEYLCQSVLSVR